MITVFEWAVGNLDSASLLGTRVLLVAYAAAAVPYLTWIMVSNRTIIARAIIGYTLFWHVDLLVLAVWVLATDGAVLSELFRAGYGASFLGCLTGLLWIIVEKRRIIHSDELDHERAKQVMRDSISVAVERVMSEKSKEGT